MKAGMPNAPCMNCKDRTAEPVNCHTVCTKYLNYINEREAIKQKYIEYLAANTNTELLISSARNKNKQWEKAKKNTREKSKFKFYKDLFR